MPIIKLSLDNGTTEWVNADAILRIRARETGSSIWFNGEDKTIGHHYRESPAIVISLIEAS